MVAFLHFNLHILKNLNLLVSPATDVLFIKMFIFFFFFGVCMQLGLGVFLPYALNIFWGDTKNSQGAVRDEKVISEDIHDSCEPVLPSA